MRNFISYLISTFALLTLLSSCEREAKVIYAIGIDEPVVRCTHTEQERTIKYRLHPNITSMDIKPNISADATWVEIIETSTIGEFTIKVEENTAEERSATISISAQGCQTAKITLTQYGTPPEKANHTLMFCFLGTSLDRYFSGNIADAKAAIINNGILGNSNRVIFFRQNSSTKGYIGEIYYDGTEIHHMDIDLSTSLMTPDELGEIMATMANIAPAERFGIVLAGHGQAWITREILDNHKDISTFSLGYNPWIQAAGAETTRAYGEKNVQFDIEELAEAIELSKVELDYILFDACFMSNIETIYELRNLANYIIASPCEIMGRGFPYERTLPYLFQNDGKESDYEGAAESYYEYYRDEVNSGSARCGSITVYDCSKIEALAEATKRAMVGAISREDRECRIDLMQTYEGQTPHHFFDFGQWINHIARDQVALENFNKAFKDCVIATFTLDSFFSAYGNYGTYPINLDVYSGVTTSAPSGAYPNGWRTTNWYKEVIALEN